jgi:hypothetical protein
MTLYDYGSKSAVLPSRKVMPMDMAGVVPGRAWTAVEEGR